MFFLILAIASSVSISLFLRLTKDRIGSDTARFTGNYAVCALLSRLYMGAWPAQEEGMTFALWLGILSGVFFLGAFLLLNRSIALNGVALSSTFMKMGVLVPTLMAVLFFHERFTGVKLAGFILALIAILLMKERGASSSSQRHFLLLLALLLTGGAADSFVNIYERLGTPACADAYLLFTFLSALLITAVLAFRDRKNIRATDLLYGAVLGIPNYYSSRFLLHALKTLPAVTVYPVYSVSVLLLVTLGGVLLFRERLSKQKWAALALILPALLLLNL